MNQLTEPVDMKSYGVAKHVKSLQLALWINV